MTRAHRAPEFRTSATIAAAGVLLALSACNGDDTVASASGLSATASDSDTETDTDTTTDTTGTATAGTTTGSTTETSTSETTGPTTGAPTTDSDSDPTTSTSDATTEPTTDSDSDSTTGTTGDVDSALCVNLGNAAGIAELNEAFVGAVLVDSRINGYFLNNTVDGANLITCLNSQIADEVGCAGVTYDCADMLTAHAGMGISTVDFDDFAEDYSAALDAHQQSYPALTDQDKADVLAALAAMAADIVEDPGSDQTIYQRVGRKPAIRDVVGLIGETDSLLDLVSKDFTINGFFLASDFVRLNTCFTRQLAGLDGPVLYGGEVDPPAADIEPGVALDNPCAAMKAGHEGLTDPNEGDSPIRYEDFVSLLTDLSAAMGAAGWAQADQDAVMAAMSPLCPEIVGDPNECPGNAQTILVKKSNLALDIPDDAYDGSLASMACVDLTVIDDGINFVSLLDELEVAIAHPEVGDLVIKVQAPSGLVSTAMSRPGLAEAMDDGEGNGGDKSILKANFPVTFRDGGLVDAEQMGIGNVVCQDDGLCDYYPNPDSGEGTDFADFLGEESKGTWRICFGDAEPGGMGSVDEVSLVISKVKFQPKP
jgi:subtilisin-like proprotein convertase family protein